MTLTLTKREKIWGLAYLLAQMLAVPFAVALVCPRLGIFSLGVMNGVSFLLCALLAAVCFRDLLMQSWRNSARNWKALPGLVLRGFGLYYLTNFIVAMVILLIQPDFANVNDASVLTMMDEAPALMTVAVIFAAPFGEECLFRGWIFTGLAKKSLPLAYCVTCGFFAAAHVIGYVGTVPPMTLALCFLQYLAPGFVLCRTCRRADSLLPPLLLHMLINAISCILLR